MSPRAGSRSRLLFPLLLALTAIVPVTVAAYAAATTRAVELRAGGTAALRAGSTAGATTPPTGPLTSRARIHSVRTFALALGARLTDRSIARLSRRDLVVVDGEETSAAEIQRLQRRGAIVLGYLSVGAVESWRSWYVELRAHQREAVPGWEDERYLDLHDQEPRDALAARIAPEVLDKGFDGLFLDHVDMVEEHPGQAAGMLDVVTRIAELVHARGGVLMTQNGDATVDRYRPLIDVWNREDASQTYDAARRRYVATSADDRASADLTLRALRAQGVVTTTTDYVHRTDGAAARVAIRRACAAGAIPLVTDIDLRRVPERPASCR